MGWISIIVQPKISEGGSYLKPEFVKKEQVRYLVIKEEFILKESVYEGKKETKLQGKVQCVTKGDPEKIWSMNWTSANTLINCLGSDTKSWQGKKVQITVMPISGHDSILVDELGTLDANKGKSTL